MENKKQYWENEEEKPKIAYDFSSLDLSEFHVVDKLRGPVKMFALTKDSRGFLAKCYIEQVQVSCYIVHATSGEVYKDKREDYIEKRRGRKPKCEDSDL
jgi:hypothetical protein